MSRSSRDAPLPQWNCFDEFFSVTYPRLAQAMSLSGEDGLDALQEAFTKAAMRWKRISRYDNPEAWVRRVALNQLSNRRRSRRREKAAVERIAKSAKSCVDGPSTTRLDVEAAIGQLTPRQQNVMVMHYLHGASTEEIAEQLGISHGAVRYHLHKARANVAATLDLTHV